MRTDGQPMKESAESGVRSFYDGRGWSKDDAGTSVDAELWEDLRACARNYVSACRLKLLEHLPRSGDRVLDAASGPVQYPEYLEYSRGFKKRVCVDISQKALDQARERLGQHGEYVRASILELPFDDDSFDAVLSLHTIYHIDRDLQEQAVRQLIRVARPGATVVIIYANPDRLLARVRRPPWRGRNEPVTSPIYYFAHPLSWWSRFSDVASIQQLPWRSLTVQDSRALIPDTRLGARLLRGVLRLEDRFPRAATRLGAYPLILLRKRSGAPSTDMS